MLANGGTLAPSPAGPLLASYSCIPWSALETVFLLGVVPNAPNVRRTLSLS